MKKLSILLVSAVIAAACTTNVSHLSGDLSVGVPIEGELAVETPDTFDLYIDAETYLFGVVQQLDVDVVVSLYDSAWNRMMRFDGPARGPEVFFAEIDKEGPYHLEVAPFKKESGRYAVEITMADPLATDPKARADQLFTPFSGDTVPGGVIGVYRDGKVLYSNAYGMADLTFGIPFSVSTPSNIGSVSKQFTAMAVLMLEQQGKLSLDDDIREYFPELPDFGKVIRIRNLLNHTNGLREVYNLLPMTGWKMEDEMRREEVIEILKREKALQADPGQEFNYNNSAFILCATLVERITGEKFPDWMAENIFGPLGMTGTVVRASSRTLIPEASQGYVMDSARYRVAGDLDGSYGAGAIYTTVDDLGKWLENFKDPLVGGTEGITRLVTPDTLNNGDTLDYAHGIGVGKYRGLKQYSHGGADIAHRAFLVYFPEIDAGVAAMSNNASFPSDNIAFRVADAFFGKDMEPVKEEKAEEDSTAAGGVKVPERILEGYAGKYRVADMGIVVEYLLKDGALVFHMEGQNDSKLIPQSDSVFGYEGVEATVTFHRDAAGKTTGATHLQGGGTFVFVPVAPYEPGPEQLAAFEGKYLSDELETFYTLAVKDSTLVLHLRNTKPVKLSPLEEDMFKGDVFYISEVKFLRDRNGKVTGFEVSNGRAKGIGFEKINN